MSLLLLSVATTFAETATLINFSEMVKDDGEHNTATLIDFSEYAGTQYSEEQKAQFRESLAIERWRVVLNGSVRGIERDRLSMAREVQSNFLGEKVMGIRVNFPVAASNLYATIEPPLSIPSLMPQDTNNIEEGDIFAPKKFDNKGAIRNIGAIRNVSMNIRGLGFNHRIAILLEDGKGKITEIPMGSLQFMGWRTITWTNKDYIRDVRKRDIKVTNKYPGHWPLLKIAGIRVYRSGEDKTSDFITYIKDITLTYDKVFSDEDMNDMNDDGTWRIMKDNEILAFRKQIDGMINKIIAMSDADKLMDKTDEGKNAPLQISGEQPIKQEPYNPQAGGEGNANGGEEAAPAN